MSVKSSTQEPKIFRLEQLGSEYIHQRRRTQIHIGKNSYKQPLRVAGKSYEDGFSTKAPTSLYISLDGNAQAFQASIGIDESTRVCGTEGVVFQAYCDCKRIVASDKITINDSAFPIIIALDGVRSLIIDIQIRNSSPLVEGICLAWINPVITYFGDPPSGSSPPSEPIYILTPRPADAPKINKPSVVGGKPHAPFFFKIPATGKKPLKYYAEDLPAGLLINNDTGLINGEIKEPGDYRVGIQVANEFGQADGRLLIKIGYKISLTPPMGWSSWHCFGDNVSDQKIRDSAKYLENSGLIDFGWTYVNIDDGWMTSPRSDSSELMALHKIIRKRKPRVTFVRTERFFIKTKANLPMSGPATTESGGLQPNCRFPNMAALATYIHDLGLKMGIFSSPGLYTCEGYHGSCGREHEDAEQFARWGVDYLKYDICTYEYFLKKLDDEGEQQNPFQIMGNALAKQNRNIIYSVCQYGRAKVWIWARKLGGDCWRTTLGIRDWWASVSEIGFGQEGKESFAGPGGWNDLDLLVVGHSRLNGALHRTELTANEQYSHVSLWCMLGSPLLISCDLSLLDAFTLNLLTNAEVIAVNQDSLGIQAWRAVPENNLEILVKPLEDGAWAVGLFNRGEFAEQIEAPWDLLKLSGRHLVRDLWRQQDLGVFNNIFSAIVPRHGVVLIKMTGVIRCS
jgi:alpha-galactosidase